MVKYLLGAAAVVIAAAVAIRWFYGVQRLFRYETKHQLEMLADDDGELITAEDLTGLPEQLQVYLTNAGVVGKPRVKYFHVTMSGDFRMNKNQDYSACKAEQYTFIESGTRLFYMTMKFKGIGISGLHHYDSRNAFMRIKILDLLKVVDYAGELMHQAETVTYFNDLCIMAPGALLDEDITWESIDETHVKGTLRKHGNEVSAIVTFNEKGMLQDFVSDDRLDVSDGGEPISIPWSTPMSGYGQVGAYYLPNVGEAIWHYPEEDFSYIRLTIEEVSVN